MPSYLTVLIPAFNEEVGLALGVASLRTQLTRLGISYEILIINDASVDRTGEIADELAGRFPEVRVVHHPMNRGIGGGFRTGVAEAQGEWLILVPADLAMDPAELGKYLQAAKEADVVVGIRSDRSDYSGWRLLVSWLNIRLIQLLFNMSQRQFNYISMYRVSVLRQMRIEYWRSAFFHAETLIKARDLGYRLAEVEIHYVPRATGRATGAKVGLIIRTLRDMGLFWIRRTFLRRNGL